MGNGQAAPSVAQLQETPIKNNEQNFFELNLAQMKLNDSSVPNIIELLTAGKHNRIDISNNEFTAVGLKQLQPALKEIRHLGLAGNPLRFEGLEALGDLLHTGPVCVLSLHNTQINEQALIDSRKFMHAIRNNKELPLRWLDLSYNALDKGIINLASVLPCAKQLTSLFLNGTIHPANPRVGMLACEALGKAIRNMPALLDLELKENGLQNECVLKLIQYCGESGRSLALSLEQNHLTDSIAEQLYEKIIKGRLGVVCVDRNWISKEWVETLKTEHEMREEKMHVTGRFVLMVLAKHVFAYEDSCLLPDPNFAEMDWPKVRTEMRELMFTKKNSYFQSMKSRQAYKFYIYEYQKLAVEPTFSSNCPMGVIFIRLFVMLLSNDLDRCLELRDNKIAIELFDFRFAFVMLSGWPVFGGLARLSDETHAVVYPLPNACDDLDSDPHQIAFRDKLRSLIEKKRAPTLLSVLEHVARHGLPQCGFGEATVRLAMASALRHHHAGSDTLESILTRDDVAILLKEGQVAFREGFLDGRTDSIYDSITTKWPLWHILDQIMLPDALPPQEDEIQFEKPSLAIHYCGSSEDVGKALLAEGSIHNWMVRVDVGNENQCGTWHASTANMVSEDYVLVVSPFTYNWSYENTHAVESVLPDLEDESINVIGFPIVNSTDYWEFPIARLRRRAGGKITYDDYPSGYQNWAGKTCLTGQATSGSRLYRADTWKMLVNEFTPLDKPNSWMLDVDMYVDKNIDFEVHTCMAVSPLYEENYRHFLTIPDQQAHRYNLDVVGFSLTNTQVVCGTSDMFVGNEMSFCMRKNIMSIVNLVKQYGVQLDQEQAVSLHYLQKWGTLPTDEFEPFTFEITSDVLPEVIEKLSKDFAIQNSNDVYEISSGDTVIAKIIPTSAVQARGLMAVSSSAQITGVDVPYNLVVFYCRHDSDHNVDRQVTGLCKEFNYECIIVSDNCMQTLSEIDTSNRFLLVISPYVIDFNSSFVLSIFANMSPQRPVIGLSHSDENNQWFWPAKRVRREYWKVIYETPPPDCDATCCSTIGATSGTRLYGPSVLQEILPHTSSTSNNGEGDGIDSFLIDLDIASAKIHVPVFTCKGDAALLTEKSYLNSANISRTIGSHYAVEYMYYSPTNSQIQCLGMDWFGVVQYGLIGSFCFRRDVERTFRSIRNWWVGSAPDGHTRWIVPEEGSMLSIWRNGKRGMIPWDSDFDAKLYDNGFISQPNATTENAECFSKDSGVLVHHYSGCTTQQYALVRRPNITHHIGDLYIAGDQSLQEYKWKSTIFNVEVRLSPHHLFHTFFERYGKPIEKYYGDGDPLHCNVPDHNACLPNCWESPATSCEFPSRTAVVDEMTADDSPLSFLGCGHLVDVGDCEFAPPAYYTNLFD